MKKLFIFLLFPIYLFAQENEQIDNEMPIDGKYLEDQFYLGLTYNILLNQPKNVSQSGLSGGVSLGYFRDIPINKKRNKAIAFGLGYGYQAYLQNLKIEEVTNSLQYSIAPASASNRFSFHSIELPIEYRWRTSTPTKYKFWRIYSGIKFSYLFSKNARFEDSGTTIRVKNLQDVDDFHFGITTAVGHGTWNFFAYYGLNKLFKNAQINGENINLRGLRIGLQFYIL